MKRRAIDPKMDDFYLFFLCKRGKSGPNVEDIFFFPLEYLFFSSLAPFSTVSS